MSIESRKSPRYPVHLDIELVYQSGAQHHAVTRDVSDGGMFVLINSELRPILGELVTIRLTGNPKENIILPSNEAVVVHTAPQGIGLAYIFMDLDEDHTDS